MITTVRPKIRRHPTIDASPQHTPGSPPGELHPPSDSRAGRLHVLTIEGQNALEAAFDAVQELEQWFNGHREHTSWLHVDGLGTSDFLRHLGQVFELHPLALEDVVHGQHRPKFEMYDNHVFIVLRVPSQRDGLVIDQLSIFLGTNWVITMQNRSHGCLATIRDRILQSKNKVKFSQADYIVYALIDAVVDAFFPVITEYSERLDLLEESLLSRPRGVDSLGDIHALRHDLRTLRRVLWPTTEVVHNLTLDDIEWISNETQVFLRDCNDHTRQLDDMLETCLELAGSLVELTLATINARLNDVMRFLTLVSTFFIPLTFIVGVYGMNFDFMPELHWRYGYVFAWIVMGFTGGLSLWLYWRRGWLANK